MKDWDNYTIRLTRGPWNKGSELVIFADNGKRIVTKFEVSDHNEFEVPESTMQLSDKSAQTLMDDLWNAGYRPTEGTGSAGSLRATEKHLNDMRKLVSKTLDVELK